MRQCPGRPLHMSLLSTQHHGALLADKGGGCPGGSASPRVFCGCEPLPSGPLVSTVTPSPPAMSQAGFRFSVLFSWVQAEPRPWRLKGLGFKSTEARLQAGVGQHGAGALCIGPHGVGAHLGVGSTRVRGWKQTGSVDSICASEPAPRLSLLGHCAFYSFPGRVQRKAHSFELTLPLSPGSFRNQASSVDRALGSWCSADLLISPLPGP